MRLQIGERIVLMLWVGSLWSIGGMVAPFLFATLDERALAGTLAGGIFSIEAYVGLVCGVMLMISLLIRGGRGAWRRWQCLAILGMLALTAIGQFGLQPWLAELRAGGLVESAAFARLHGLAALLYLATALLGLAVVAAGLPGFAKAEGRAVKAV